MQKPRSLALLGMTILVEHPHSHSRIAISRPPA
jgi:hypothetical protein